MVLKRFRSNVDRAIRLAFPNLYYLVIQRPKIKSQFRVEKRLIQGEKLSSSKKNSIIFFTTQKCASQFVSSVIKRLTENEGMVHANLDAYVAMVRLPQEQNPFKQDGAMGIAFQPHGYYYGPIGTYRAIADMERYRVLLQLRDPRDVLTSLYYSTLYSHALINQRMIKRRQEAQKMTIDEFAISGADEYLEIYQGYIERLLDTEMTLFLKYEDMVASFDDWLAKLVTHFGLAPSQNVLSQIQKEANFSVDREDKFSQRRQVTPGDHKRKLKRDTINRLNVIFENILKRLEYEIN